MATVIAATPLKTSPRKRRGRAGRAGGQFAAGWLTYSILAVVLIVSIFPFFWTIVAASTSNTEINKVPPNLIPGGNLLKNFHLALTNVNMGSALLNSTIVSTSVAAGTVLFGTLAGFAFAKLRFRGRNALLLITIAHDDGADADRHRAALHPDEQAAPDRPAARPSCCRRWSARSACSSCGNT